MRKTLDDAGLDLLFRNARTQNGWLETPVSDEQLRAIYQIMRLGPTSANCCPARITFLRTPEAKARLLPALSPGNVDKTNGTLWRSSRFSDRLRRGLGQTGPDVRVHQDLRTFSA